MDVLERILYNVALAGISLDGTAFFYTNTLRQLDRMPVDLRWSRPRRPFLSSFCCPPNVVRTLAEVADYAYARSEQGIWVNLYGGSVLDTRLADGSRLKRTQESDHPWNGRVKIIVNAAPTGTFSVQLRIPAWAGSAALSVDGMPEHVPLKPGVPQAWASPPGRTILICRRQSIGFLGLDPEPTRLPRISHVQAMGPIFNLHVFGCGNGFCATAGSEV